MSTTAVCQFVRGLRLSAGCCFAARASLVTALLISLGGMTELRGQGTPSCNLDPRVPVQQQIDAIRKCAIELDAAGAFESGIAGTNDQQWLDEGVPPQFNCIGSLWAEERAHTNSVSDLGSPRDGGGRVTLKVLIEQGPGAEECTGYHQGPVKLPLGVSYVFVYSLGRIQTNGKKPAHIIIVPESAGEQAKFAPMQVCWHEQYGYEHAHARWLHDPKDARGWWTCVHNGCCNMP